MEAALGTLMAGTDQVVFQQFRQRSLRPVTSTTSPRSTMASSSPVQPSKWEYWPAGSQEFILFLRHFPGRREHRELVPDPRHPSPAGVDR